MTGHIATYLLNEADDRTALFAGSILLIALVFIAVVGGYAWWQERKETKNKKAEQ